MRRLTVVLFVLAVLAAAVWLRRDLWLTFLGGSLIRTDAEPTSAAEVLVIPAADYITNDTSTASLRYAARLVVQGRAGSILMSCPDWYGVSVCELAQATLAQQGFSDIKIQPLHLGPLPDDLEADLLVSHLSKSRLKTAIIMLPNYKTRRLGAVYRKLARQHGIAVFVAASPSTDFNPNNWWLTRKSRRLFSYETTRWLGIL
jgi:hypothetical protein